MENDETQADIPAGERRVATIDYVAAMLKWCRAYEAKWKRRRRRPESIENERLFEGLTSEARETLNRDQKLSDEQLLQEAGRLRVEPAKLRSRVEAFLYWLSRNKDDIDGIAKYGWRTWLEMNTPEPDENGYLRLKQR